MWKGQVCQLERHLKDCIYATNNIPRWLMERFQCEARERGKSEEVVDKQHEPDNHPAEGTQTRPSALTLELLQEKGEEYKSKSVPQTPS